MILPQLRVVTRVNNQITITRQLVNQNLQNRERCLAPVPLSEARATFFKKASDLGQATYTDHRQNTIMARTDYKGIIRLKTLPHTLFPSPPLDLKNNLQDKKAILRGYGIRPLPKSFGYKSGQRLRECGAAIDILCKGKPELCRVVTLTLPASGSEAYSVLSRFSSFIINRLFQILRDTTEENAYWFYVWEHQKRGALHLHICLFDEDKKRSSHLGELLLKQWIVILDDLTNRTSVNMMYSKGLGMRTPESKMQSLNQEMIKGCGAYFSKYASKTSNVKEDLNNESINSKNAKLYPVGQFWGSSKALKKVVKENCFDFYYTGMNEEYSNGIQSFVMELLSQYSIVTVSQSSFSKSTEPDSNGKSILIAEGKVETYYLSPSDYQFILNELRFFRASWITETIPERGLKGDYIGVPCESTF